jgi:hypothetical protein
MANEDRPDPDVLKEYVSLQAKTPCRKCKKVDWTLEEGFGRARGGDRVGIFVVLGASTETVFTATFACKECGNRFERPVYSRSQLANQEFPAVQLDVRADEPPRDPKRNGKP